MGSDVSASNREVSAVLEKFIGGHCFKLRDKRSSPRTDYPARILFAPYDGTRLPAQDEYVPVHARDLSTSGVAFYAEEVPDSGVVALCLGTPPQPCIYLEAKIVRVSSGYFQRRRQLIVSCRFLSRLESHRVT